MRISDWSSDVCSSDLVPVDLVAAERVAQQAEAPRLAKDEGELPAGPGEIGCGRVEGSEEAFQRRGASRRAMAEQSRTQDRSEERRVGNEGVSKGRSRGAEDNYTQTMTKR